MDAVCTWWPQAFDHVNRLDTVKDLLDEMVGLGVLRQTQSGAWALRSHAILRLLGDEEHVMVQSSTLFEAAAEYWTDAAQRGVLFMETLNERGNTYIAQSAKTAPHVLNFPVEILRDGRTLERPANYALVRIVPPNDVTIDPLKPPIVVVDPRAGHGPGIGGMKPESEIGVALRAGHPVYFIGFLPKPEPGHTIEDVCLAEGTFIEDVAQRHAEAASKPIVIANCQAGWQTMMMASIRPGLTGPIILAGSPLSYWAGVRGKNPMRYLGGLLGGTWLTELSGDLGAGIFDGAHLVANFESLNPANTYWTKPYNVYSKVDTEPERFLDFETWWGNPVLLNAGEMQCGRTEFSLRGGALVGHYWIDDAQPFEGELTGFVPDGGRSGTFTWTDRYGVGVMYVRFAGDGRAVECCLVWRGSC